MSNLNRIRRAGRVMSGLCSAIIVVLPLGLALIWANLETLGPAMVGQAVPDLRFGNHGAGTLILGFAISMIPVLVLIYGLIQLRQLFGLYGQGRIFSSLHAVYLRRFALASILSVFAQIVSSSLISVVLTFHNPPGARHLTVSVTSDHLGTVFLGSVLLVIAWIMVEGSKIAEDNAQIV